MNFPWRDGNRVELLINGEEYFPRLFQCIAEARREILLETFIIFEDEVGRSACAPTCFAGCIASWW